MATSTVDVERVELGDRRHRLVRTQRFANPAKDLVERFVEPFDRKCSVARVELLSVTHASVRSGLRSFPERRRGTPSAELLVDVARPKADPLDDLELLSSGTAERERGGDLDLAATGEIASRKHAMAKTRAERTRGVSYLRDSTVEQAECASSRSRGSSRWIPWER